MKNKYRTFCSICVYNEGPAIQSILDKFNQPLFEDWLDELIIIDDGSTDDTPWILSKYPYPVIRHPKNLGVGAVHKTSIEYGQRHNYEVMVIMAGNGKMQPSEIPNLVRPIFEEGYDFVQGSRYLKGGHYDNIPLFRYIIQRIGSTFIRILFGWPGNDVSCGFRAVRMSVFDHPDINVFQNWLDGYSLEPYLQYKVVHNGFKIEQVPASMIYPSDRRRKYTKIPVISGWWEMARPWILLKLGLKS